MYHQLVYVPPVSVYTTSSNIEELFILLTYFIYTFCVYLPTHSEFRLTLHPMFSIITEIASVYCAVRPRHFNRTGNVSSSQGQYRFVYPLKYI